MRFKRRNANRRSSACTLMRWGFGRPCVAACRTHGRELMCTPRSASFIKNEKRISPSPQHGRRCVDGGLKHNGGDPRMPPGVRYRVQFRDGAQTAVEYHGAVRSSMSKSSLALNNLRGFAIVMVVAFHSFIAYLGSQPASQLPFDLPPYGWRANPIVDSARWFGFDLFCAFQYVYLMHLMFFLSGLFVWPSLSRKGGRRFLYDRFVRLGIPFAVGLYLLMPLAYYPVYRITAVDPSWSAFWSHWIALPFWPSGPMWFLWLLLLFNIAAAALFWLPPRAGEALGGLSAKAGSHPGQFFIALVSISALAYLPL